MSISYYFFQIALTMGSINKISESINLHIPSILSSLEIAITATVHGI